MRPKEAATDVYERLGLFVTLLGVLQVGADVKSLALLAGVADTLALLLLSILFGLVLFGRILLRRLLHGVCLLPSFF